LVLRSASGVGSLISILVSCSSIRDMFGSSTLKFLKVIHRFIFW
jgi:hypothetical protein